MFGVAIRGDQSSTGTSNQIFFWGAGTTTTSAIGFKANGGSFPNPTGNGDGYNTYLTMDTDGRGWVFRRGTGGTDFTSANNSGWILNNGVWQANASMRAPIFYDSNDTTYYLDPNSTGTSLNLAGYAYIGKALSAGNYLSLNHDQVWAQNQLHLQWSSAGNVAMCNGGGYAWSVTSMRSPIFYDYNDTGYYLDPAGTSDLNVVDGPA
jgi:hypothetical protein